MSTSTTVDMQRYEGMARVNFDDPAFSDLIQSTRALRLFQGRPLTADSLRAQAAILNGLLLYHLDASDLGFAAKKIEGHLWQFDCLLANAAHMLQQGSHELQAFAQTIFYYRLGDYLMSALKSKVMRGEDSQSQVVLALCAYTMALKGVDSMPPANEDALFTRLELSCLIRANFSPAFEYEDLMHALSNRKTHDLLLSCIRPKHWAAAAAGVEETHVPFLTTNNQLGGEWAHHLDLEVVINNSTSSAIWRLHHRGNTANFLRRLVHLLSGEGGNNYYALLDGVALKKLPSNLDEPCTPDNLTLMDLKVFLFRLVAGHSVGEGMAFPWVLAAKPTSRQCHVWELMLGCVGGASNGSTSPARSISKVVALTNAMEELRAVSVPSLCDKANMAQTMSQLEEVALRTQGDERQQALYGELAERYAFALLQCIDSAGGGGGGAAKVPSTKSLFPPSHRATPVVMDDELADAANLLIAKRLYSVGQHTAAERRLAELSDPPLPPCPDDEYSRPSLSTGLHPSKGNSHHHKFSGSLTPNNNRSLSGAMLDKSTSTEVNDGDDSIDSDLSSTAGGEVAGAARQQAARKQKKNQKHTKPHSNNNNPPLPFSGQQGNREAEELRRVISKYIYHNSLLTKFIASQTANHHQGNGGDLSAQPAAPKIGRPLSAKLLLHPRVKPVDCAVGVQKRDGTNYLSITQQQQQSGALPSEYQLGGNDFKYEVISGTTIRLCGMKPSTSPSSSTSIMLSFPKRPDYVEFLALLSTC